MEGMFCSYMSLSFPEEMLNSLIDFDAGTIKGHRKPMVFKFILIDSNYRLFVFH